MGPPKGSLHAATPSALPVAVTSALRPVQLTRQPHVRLVITRILRPPPPKMLRAPACGIVYLWGLYGVSLWGQSPQ